MCVSLWLLVVTAVDGQFVEACLLWFILFILCSSFPGGSDDTWTESEEVPEDDSAVR